MPPITGNPLPMLSIPVLLATVSAYVPPLARVIVLSCPFVFAVVIALINPATSPFAIVKVCADATPGVSADTTSASTSAPIAATRVRSLYRFPTTLTPHLLTRICFPLVPLRRQLPHASWRADGSAFSIGSIGSRVRGCTPNLSGQPPLRFHIRFIVVQIVRSWARRSMQLRPRSRVRPACAARACANCA